MTFSRLNGLPDAEHGRPLSRSSHGISYIENPPRLIVFGGEHQARTPIPNEQCLWEINLLTLQWTWIDSSQVPSRVAHAQATVNNRVYVFGGRAGVLMNEQPFHDLWCFDPEERSWTALPMLNDPPEPRSFHKMIGVGSSLWIFGGCGSSGRMADMHEYRLDTKTWHAWGSSLVLSGRGGANLLALDAHRIVVLAGFAGKETNDGHVFNIDNKAWEKEGIVLEGMRARSVCASASVEKQGILVIFGGEVDPSDRGHEGAGGFENDVIILDRDTMTLVSTTTAAESDWPEKRGWADAAASKDKVYVFGGLAGDDENPRRLDDLWVLGF